MTKSNVEILKEHGALEGQDLTEEQLAAIDEHFTEEEMQTLVKLRQKVMDHPKGTKGGVF